ncbi:aspartate carbamoyltransferase regulatory subunit [Breznakiella homolactica]|uniref:Aspartate carbamoyltransferase regulatory subunit n=1 Tax=Breznakiella homolactica TaxID=2798577 RepID=A0A7T7XQH1_9SPIR|nr:aspartate carbamoyltransferase regulatory subunit [Breznakiella homolactica]QQO10552.1 aspartate carbamoyltransferase regulatory subunit [Breznakiella homolactica]
MLNIAKIKNGIVIDHIKAGQGIKIFNWLKLDKAPYTVAFVVNASSDRMGRKDIIKIDDTITIDFPILGLIDPSITVNIIENEVITEKIQLRLPERVENILTCKNPRCVTYTEKYIPHIFLLEDAERGSYRCEYCDEIRFAGDFR